jgi:hypothetical protein
VTAAALLLILAACVATVAFAAGVYAVAWSALGALACAAAVLIVADEMGCAN